MLSRAGAHTSERTDCPQRRQPDSAIFPYGPRATDHDPPPRTGTLPTEARAGCPRHTRGRRPRHEEGPAGCSCYGRTRSEAPSLAPCAPPKHETQVTAHQRRPSYALTGTLPTACSMPATRKGGTPSPRRASGDLPLLLRAHPRLTTHLAARTTRNRVTPHERRFTRPPSAKKKPGSFCDTGLVNSWR